MQLDLNDFVKEIKGQILTQSELSSITVSGGYVCDLLSDVMGSARENDLWITIMRHLNVVAVASLAGISTIVFAKNIKPEEAVINKANDEGICLISSELSTFELAGILYKYK